MHVTGAMLMDYADGELGRSDRERVTRHVSECAGCQAALGEVRSTQRAFATLLAELDDAEPAWRADRPFIFGQPAAERVRSNTAPAFWRWAAGIALLSGAATALAVVRSIGFDAGTAGVSEDAPPAAAAPSARAASGVLVDAVDGVVDIELREAAAGTRISVSFAGTEQVGVQSQGNVNPGFVAQRGRVVVQLHGSAAELGLILPRELPLLRISAQGKVVALVERGTISVVANDAGIAVESRER